MSNEGYEKLKQTMANIKTDDIKNQLYENLNNIKSGNYNIRDYASVIGTTDELKRRQALTEIELKEISEAIKDVNIKKDDFINGLKQIKDKDILPDSVDRMKFKPLSLNDLKKIDILDMTNEDIENIRNWCISNNDYLKKNYSKIKDPFEEVIILYQSNLIYKSGDIFYIYFYNKKANDNPKYMYGFKLNFEENRENMMRNKPITNIEFLESYKDVNTSNMQNNFASQDLMIISFIYSYLAFNQESIIRETKTHTKKVQSKKDKRAGKKPKVKLIKQNIIRLNTDHIEAPTEEEKREYERHIAGWTVRGHWREYKSGKRVWIKPQIRGDKEQVQGKIYEVN